MSFPAHRVPGNCLYKASKISCASLLTSLFVRLAFSLARSRAALARASNAECLRGSKGAGGCEEAGARERIVKEVSAEMGIMRWVVGVVDTASVEVREQIV